MTDMYKELNSCRILFSTQSGRSKAAARRTSRILSEQTNLNLENAAGSTFDDGVSSLPDLVQSLKNSFLILFVSTTGDGEHTDSIQHFWRQL
jgi:sulfite reductase alpha subunit-like flavoprotein